MTEWEVFETVLDRVVARADGLGVAALAAAMFAGLAAALSVRSPAAQLAHVRTGTPRRWAGPTAQLGTWLGGRPGTPPWPRRLLVSTGVGVALAVALHSRAGLGVPAAMGLALVVAMVCTGLLGHFEPVAVRQRRLQQVADLPHALELMAAALDAGLPLRSATHAVVLEFDGPIAEDLWRVLGAVELGIPDGEAWRELSDEAVWRRVALDLARSAESGTMLVHTLRHHAADARAARVAQTQVRARAVGVRSVLPLMVCFMPAFLLIGVVPTVASALDKALF